MRENTDQKNSEYGHFLRSDINMLCKINRGYSFCGKPNALESFLKNSFDQNFLSKFIVTLTIFNITLLITQRGI